MVRPTGRQKLGDGVQKSMVPKGKNGAPFLAKKKENNIPKEVVAHVVKERPKVKAVPPRGGGFKKVPEPLARKTEASKGLRNPSMPTKASSSKLSRKKAEAES